MRYVLEILSMFKKGAAPSAIDRELRLPMFTAHDVIVNHWIYGSEDA